MYKMYINVEDASQLIYHVQHCTLDLEHPLKIIQSTLNINSLVLLIDYSAIIFLLCTGYSRVPCVRAPLTSTQQPTKVLFVYG